jgi:hypothetical protein
MKTFKNRADQGEIRVTKIDRLPNGLAPISPENGVFIVGHSETGHHHVMTMDRAEFYADPNPPAGMTVLYAILAEPKELIHQRDFDTHEPILHAPGIYKFTTSREHDHYAELARKAAD